MKTGKEPPTACPCGSDTDYAACCGPLHRGMAAPDALALMRSRYCAYTRADADYLLRTWHPTTRPVKLPGLGAPGEKWLGLKIIAHEALSPDRQVVEFVARYRHGGARAVRLHEKSNFVREQGNWFYLDGRQLP